MIRPRLSLALLAVPVMALAGEPTFKKHDINPKSIFECAGAWDVDNDGKIDIVSGDTWYKAPDWTPYPVRPVEMAGRTYTNDFSNIPLDMNGDGNVDFVTCSYFGKSIGWVENPGKAGQKWTYHEVDKPGNSEAMVRVDLDGDGVGDFLPNTVNVVTWYSPEKAADGKGYTLKRHDFAAYKGSAGHGVGTGDMNGDGKLDILTPNGWFEAVDPKKDSWTWHPDWKLPATGIQIYGRDLDGDGVTDVIYGMGHAVGLYWRKGQKSADGKVTLGKDQLIDKDVSSVHTLLWADLDGDGKDNELVTGKRVYAHEREPGDIDSPIVAYYTFDPASKAWDRHIIAKGEPAKDAPADPGKRDAQKDFKPGTAGTGLEMTAVDIDGDGDLDLVCPGKSGLYLFENLLKSK
jgi:hypothetical protein